MTTGSTTGEPIDRVFAALAAGDLAAAKACFADDAVVWHGFDRIERDRTETIADWKGLVDGFPERGVQDVRRRSTGDGVFLQQHLFVLGDDSGTRRAWPVCIVVKITDGLISRLDEYIDRAGSFIAPAGPLSTPGF